MCLRKKKNGSGRIDISVHFMSRINSSFFNESLNDIIRAVCVLLQIHELREAILYGFGAAAVGATIWLFDHHIAKKNFRVYYIVVCVCVQSCTRTFHHPRPKQISIFCATGETTTTGVLYYIVVHARNKLLLLLQPTTMRCSTWRRGQSYGYCNCKSL